MPKNKSVRRVVLRDDRLSYEMRDGVVNVTMWYMAEYLETSNQYNITYTRTMRVGKPGSDDYTGHLTSYGQSILCEFLDKAVCFNSVLKDKLNPEDVQAFTGYSPDRHIKLDVKPKIKDNYDLEIRIEITRKKPDDAAGGCGSSVSSVSSDDDDPT